MSLTVLVLIVPAGARAARVDWRTYGFGPSRASINPHERDVGPREARALVNAWSTDLGGVIESQPLVAFGVALPGGGSADVVYAGTESGRFAALDAGTGEVLWTRDLGSIHIPECYTTKGVTDTGVINRSRGSVYVVGGTGRLFELDLATGATRHTWTITSDPRHEHVWSALTSMRGRLYVPVSGICDVPPYHGRVVAFDMATARRVARWYVTSRHGPNGGGIWAWGGVSADPRRNAIFAATGNSLPNPDAESQGYAEHVVRLDGSLRVRASHEPDIDGYDADFGATPMLYRVRGCPPQLVVGNKYGQFMVYDRAHLARGPVQTIRLGGSGFGTLALLGNAAIWNERRMVYVSNPQRREPYKKGILAFHVTKHCHLKLAWRAKMADEANLTSSPTLANGVLYYANGRGSRLVALNAWTGRRLWHSGSTIGGHMYNAPAVAGGAVYIGSFDQRLYKFVAGPAPAPR